MMSSPQRDIGHPQGSCHSYRTPQLILPRKRIVAKARCGEDEILVKIFLGHTAPRYASREQTGVSYLQDSGVRTPDLLWKGRFSSGQGRVLAFQYLEDATSLQEKWDRAIDDDERIDILSRVMIIIGKMHNQGVAQTDIHLANFLISQGRIFTIDGGEVIRKT